MATTTAPPILNPSALTEVSDALTNARELLTAETDKMARAVRDQNPMSRTFVGYIREYRYTTGRKGEMPSHRFYLECGGGVWLYAKVPSNRFEAVMRDMEIDFTTEELDGRMLVCAGDTGVNAVVPVEFVTPTDPVAYDRFNNYLYRGAPVIWDTESKPRTGLVQRRNADSSILVSLDDGDSPVNVLVENLARNF